MSIQNIFIILMGLGINGLIAQNNSAKHHANFPLDCAECHICKKPTFEKPCLKIVPDFKREGITVHHSAKDAPELLKIDVLSSVYEPSIFTHKLHAEMAEMSGGCSSCHHFNPPGKIVACRECHEASLLRTDLSKPGLKGAYHRQCMNCHRTWSHENDCVVCHAQKMDETETAKLSDKEKYLGIAHKKIIKPGKLLYKTEYDEGPLVTFYHDEHVNLFSVACVDCHQNENCGRCHDMMKTTTGKEEEPHENCLKCHEEDIAENCEKCHADKELKRFNHLATGWPLGKYHDQLNCGNCHDQDGKFFKPIKNCINCHQNWKSGKFNHKVTGLDLDEIHSELDCSDCHADNKFTAKPVCADCHDDYLYPAQKPGRRSSVK